MASTIHAFANQPSHPAELPQTAFNVLTVPPEIFCNVFSNFSLTSRDFQNIQKVCTIWLQISRETFFLNLKLNHSIKIHLIEAITAKHIFKVWNNIEVRAWSLIDRCVHLRVLVLSEIDASIKFNVFFKNMPRTVRKLELDHCPKLSDNHVKDLPKSLQFLSIQFSNLKTPKFKNFLELKKLELQGGKFFGLTLKNLPSLTELNTSQCPKFSLVNFLGLNSIKKMNFDDCSSLLNFQLIPFNTLEELRISNCRSFLGLHLEEMPCLRTLSIQSNGFRWISLIDLPSLEKINISDLSLLRVFGLRRLPSLKELHLKIAVNLEALLITELKSLKKFSIEHANLLKTPHLIFSDTPNVKEYSIYNCPLLSKIHFETCMKKTKLISLRKCPNLAKANLRNAKKLDQLTIEECGKMKKISVYPLAPLRSIKLIDFRTKQKANTYLQLLPASMRTMLSLK